MSNNNGSISSFVFRRAPTNGKDLAPKVQNSSSTTMSTTKGNCSINGLPDLLPVAPRPAPPPPPQLTNLAPSGYILVPASAVGIRSIGSNSIASLRLIPAGTFQQTTASGGTFVVVGPPSAKIIPTSSTTAVTSNSASWIGERSSSSGSRPSNVVDSCCANIVDDASLRQSMGRNRETLKRKLLQRRTIRELVDQGILPPPKTPPSYYEQRIKLERAKMSDILKHKIEHRPDKQQLVSQHILMDSSADPGILEKQRQLKKCKLADSLNDKLANRPGPLELVQENILHVDAALEQAIKDGRLQFKPTSAGLIQKHPPPVFVVTQDGSTTVGGSTTIDHGAYDCSNIAFDSTNASLNHHSSSSSSPLLFGGQSPSIDLISNATAVTPTLTAVATFASPTPKQKPKKPKTKVRPIGSSAVSASKSGNNTSGGKANSLKVARSNDCRKSSSSTITPTLASATIAPSSALENRGGGPSSMIGGFAMGMMNNVTGQSMENTGMIVGQSSIAASPPFEDDETDPEQETSYDLLLEQQQLMLQWQYELQQKYPNSTVQLVSLSSSASSSVAQQQQRLNQFSMMNFANSDSAASIQSSPGSYNCVMNGNGGSLPQTPAPMMRSDSDVCATHGSTTAPKSIKRLEDLKVNDLKMECKRRNLPVSGSKSNIVERLKTYEDVILAAMQSGQKQQSDSPPSGGSTTAAPIFPTSPNCQNNAQVRAALPPISFLCANANAQNSFGSSAASSPNGNNAATYGQLNAPSTTVGMENLTNGYANRSSSCSDYTSAYSSPGIDLSVLNFGGNGHNANSAGVGCGEDLMNSGMDTSTTTAQTTTTEQYTFSTPNFGAQFLVTSKYDDQQQQQQVDGTKPTASAGHGQNGNGDYHRSVGASSDAPIPNVGSMSASPIGASSNTQPQHQQFQEQQQANSPSQQQQQQQQHHQRLPFLQAAKTLTVHEEALRQQQKKIEEVQKELQKSQDLLKQQQQMIMAAKQMQTEANESGMSDADFILSQLDTKQIQKAHIQLFLQQKIQQQQLQQQINVQQELMEIQQKLQEEMTVHQALNEVVRLLRQEPRISILVLHLLRRHQIEQQQQRSHNQQQTNVNRQSAPTPPANLVNASQGNQISGENAASGDGRRNDLGSAGTTTTTAATAVTFAPMKRSADGYQVQQSTPPQCPRNSSASPTSNVSTVSSYQGGQVNEQPPTEAASKCRPTSAQQQQTKKIASASPALQSPYSRANSVPTSPMKSKSSSSMGDMEEIFRSVLDYATKATEKLNENGQQPQNAGMTLPSFEQLLQPQRPVSEIETAITITNGSGILMTSAAESRHHQQQQPQRQLSTLDHHLPSAIENRHHDGRFGSNVQSSKTADAFDSNIAVNETAGASPSMQTSSTAAAFLYTRNEAFDDLMEVLRNNEAPILDDPSNDEQRIEQPSSNSSCPSSLVSHMGNDEDISSSMGGMGDSSSVKSKHSDVSQAHQQLNLLSAFGAQEVADLLGTEWFNVESLLPQPGSGGGTNDSLNMAQSPDLNAFGVSVLSSGRAESKPLTSSSSSSRLDDSHANGSVVLVTSDMSDQMDWLDLILPSPSSAGGGGGANGILHDLPVMNCLSMDTDNNGHLMMGDSMNSRRTSGGGDSLLNGNGSMSCDDFGTAHHHHPHMHHRNSLISSTHNPVLAMSACGNGDGL